MCCCLGSLLVFSRWLGCSGGSRVASPPRMAGNVSKADLDWPLCLSVLSLGLYRCYLQQGSQTPYLVAQGSESESFNRQEVKANGQEVGLASLLTSGPENWYSFTPNVFCWSKQSQTLARIEGKGYRLHFSKGGV